MQDPTTGAYYTDESRTELVLVPNSVESFTVIRSVEKIAGGDKNTAAFRECSKLSMLFFESGSKLTSIGKYGCYGLKIDVLDLRNCTLLTEISAGAFFQSSISQLFLPPNLKYIKTAAFASCSNLLYVDFPDSLLEISGYSSDGGPFMRCTKLSINFSVNSKITKIGSTAFAYSNIPNIYIPQNLTSLDNKVYAATKTVSISVHPLNMVYKAGTNCLLSRDGKSLCHVFSSITGTFEVPEGIEKIMSGVFAESSVEEVVIPSTVTTLSYQVFSYATKLKRLSMPDSIKSIGSELFESCSSLASVHLSAKTSSITSKMFYYCTSLTNVTIPSGCSSIGAQAFYGCSSLKYVYVPKTVKTIAGASFAKTHPDIVIDFENGSDFSIRDQVLYSADGKYAIQYIGETGANFNFTVDSKVEQILESCFEGKMIEAVIFDYSTTKLHSILRRAFYGSSLKQITLPSTINVISKSAFEYCTSLKSVSFYQNPEGITTISERVFALSALESFDLPPNIKTIELEAFYECSKLSSITFDSSSTTLISISKSAFAYTGLGSITIPKGVCSLGIESFRGSKVKWILFESEMITEIPIGCFKGCNNLGSITLGKSIWFVRSESFADCSELTSVTIGDQVSHIEANSFSRCPKLTSIAFGDRSNISSIYASAFSGCSSLKMMSVPLSNTQLSTEDDLLFDGHRTKIILCLPNRANGDLVIPSTVEEISPGAFGECLSLFSVSVEACSDGSFALESIGFQAFIDCKALKRLSIPLSVQSIGAEAFAGCGLSDCGSVEFPELLKSKLIDAGISQSALEVCPSMAFTSNVVHGSALLASLHNFVDNKDF